MDTELDKALCEDFPMLFGDRHGDPRQTAMCWGFPGNGWEPLIRQAAEVVEPLVREFWEGLSDEEREGREPPRAAQVKEKYGGLRFYMTYFPRGKMEEAEDAIRLAETRSERTCEVCGDFGVPRKGGWILTLCDEHADRPPSGGEIVQLDYALYSGEPLDFDVLLETRRSLVSKGKARLEESRKKWKLRRAITKVVREEEDDHNLYYNTDEEELAERLIEKFGDED